MKIIQTSTYDELAFHNYIRLAEGLYACAEESRILFVEPDDSALLVIKTPDLEMN